MAPCPTAGNLDSRGDVFNLNTGGGDTQKVDISETQMDNSDVPDDSGEGTSMNTSRCATPAVSSRSASSLSEQYSRKRKVNVQDEVTKKMLHLEEQKLEVLKRVVAEKCEDFHFLMSLPPLFKELPPLKKLSVRN